MARPADFVQVRHRFAVGDRADVPVQWQPETNLVGDAYVAELQVSNEGDTVPEGAWTVDMADAATGLLVLRLTGTETAALGEGSWFYALKRTTASGPQTIFDGVLILEDR